MFRSLPRTVVVGLLSFLSLGCVLFAVLIAQLGHSLLVFLILRQLVKIDGERLLEALGPNILTNSCDFCEDGLHQVLHAAGGTSNSKRRLLAGLLPRAELESVAAGLQCFGLRYALAAAGEVR